ncbi:aminotransferase class V-fold PLP-dependent enzyme [Fusibacter paucivorans]|uniref:cysteine desulfurase n=1 Tax=Fusibacter paucivorans TaxID=76009 RepID=A0ABS5PMX1_9FIRM|nr:aminotransferase class V-fold PLP-dependent enzyme [Fusibacter paucivorans]MBS7526413.1 aminotransferase class V-fold PLP-dependent enzyme [Fusibacter paucivorans]
MKVYLDNSATSFPKPLAVEHAVTQWFRDGYGNVSRSSGSGTRQLERLVYETREALSTLFNFPDLDHIVFTKHITEALNIVIFGFLKAKDHVIVTGVEHNGVIRPLEALKERIGVTYTALPVSSLGVVDLAALEQAVRPNTKLIISTHASNVTGDVMPIEDIGKFAYDNDIVFMVDSAQTAGVLPIDMQAQHIDLLAFTGHKGLMGPQGIGGLLIRPELVSQIKPLIYGGTGSYSEQLSQPDTMPDRYESGTLNSLGIVGLHAGINTIQKIGLDRVLEHEQQLIRILQEAFQQDSRVRLIGNPDYSKRVGVLSMQFLTIDNALVAYELSKQFGISTRVGLHCSPLAHQVYNTYPSGTVRFSTSFLNTVEELHYAVAGIKEILSQG